MFKRFIILIFSAALYVFAQSPYLPGETVLPEHNLSWTDNNSYSTNIFDEVALKKNVVVIFWGGYG